MCLLLISLVTTLLLGSCRQRDVGERLFAKLPPARTGVTFGNMLVEEPLFNSVNYLYFYDGGGVAAGDINNDGLVDLYFTANMQPNRLYLNKGNVTFEDITENAGVGGDTEAWTTGVTMADVNGDGLLDIYVCQTTHLDRKGPNQLFINNGDLTFTERAAEYGLAHIGLSRQAAFFDYDLDGDLDMYLMNHSVHSKGTYGTASSKRAIRDDEAGDKLFRNDHGHFVDVTREAGIYSSILGYGLGVAVGDINWDGYPDIYIANDFHEDDYLYYNNGDGTFTEAMRRSMRHVSSASMGNDLADFNNDGLLDLVVLDMLPEKEEIRKASVSADPYDIYDTKLEYGYYHQLRRNTLQLNRGPANSVGKPTIHLFSDIGQLADVHATDWSWAALFADLDNDGYKDLFVTNGIYLRPNDLDYLAYIKSIESELESGGRSGFGAVKPIDQKKLDEIVRHMPSVPLANYAFYNRGDLTFVNRAAEWGLDDAGFSSGAAYADLDNDGDLDLVVNNVNAAAGIYQNLLYSEKTKDALAGKSNSSDRQIPQVNNRVESQSVGRYLKVRLKGRGQNAFGIGTKVRLRHQGQIFYQEMMPTRGFQSSVQPILHFGLGAVEYLDSLEVIWPTGEYQVLKNVATNQTIELLQEAATRRYDFKLPQNPTPLFRDVSAETRLDYVHEENTFFDYNREPFIPRLVSSEGPACAVADVDGDGLSDLFLGGAKHQPGRIFLQSATGSFAATIDSVFAEDGLCEDVDAAFFDANGDGLVDLYVVSGGNEFWGKADALKDRLYLNEGRGRFRKAGTHLPDIYANGACVKPADFDADGDIDLFVGSRTLPRLYGIIPESYLLINDGQGVYRDGTKTLAPELAEVGMVTDAAWADLNGDGALDLVVVGEWMPITVFQNEQGTLVDATEKYDLQNTRGWWNTVAAGDFNQDGLVDLVAGNLGLNSILKASPEKPVRLFIEDFSGDGKIEQILTYFNGDKAYPLASAEQMLKHIPFLKETFPTNAAFAGQPIESIFPRKKLQQAIIRSATEFASLLLLNRGHERFDVQRLPMEAQFSPIQAILVEDFNEDGHQDLLLGGNFHGVPPDQGRYDASYGSLLLGDGTGRFTPMSLQESGFVVTGEVRCIESLHTASGKMLIIAARNRDTVAIFEKR